MVDRKKETNYGSSILFALRFPPVNSWLVCVCVCVCVCVSVCLSMCVCVYVFVDVRVFVRV